MPEDLLARVDEILAGEQRLKIEFDEADSPEQLDLLRTGALSFGVMRVFRDEDGLAARTLADRPLGVVLSPDHPLTGHCVLSWADLADQELLWFPSGRNPNFSEGVLGHLAERGWTPRLRIVDGHNHAQHCRHLRSSPNLVALRPQDTVGAEAGMAWRPLPPDAPHERFVLAAPVDSPVGGCARHAA
jgi:DNA-binding transcriptional LysR family regulator